MKHPMHDDGRNGLPSGSAMARIAACPVSHHRALASEPEPDSAESESGTAIHAALAGQPIRPLSSDEEDVAARCHADRREVILHWREEFPEIDDMDIDRIVERRFYVRDGLEPVASTRIDELIYERREGGPVLAWDYKTGRGEHDPAADNYQLRTNVAALHSEGFRGRPIMVALIEPMVGKPTVAAYRDDDIVRAHEEIVRISRRAMTTNEPPIAGEWCRYCPARTHCEAFEAVERRVSQLPTAPDTWSMMDAGEKLEALRLWKIVKQSGHLIELRVRQDLKEDPESIPGVRLTPGVVRRTITDPAVAYEMTVEGEGKPGISPAAFAKLCTVPIGKLETAYAEAVAKKGEKTAVKKDLAARLEAAGAVEKKRTEPKLELVK